jgi:transcriptional regulator with XRE-family HTH domain
MLGQRIAALRRHLGLSQSALAEKIGVSPSAVGMYEQDRREPSLSAMVTMSEVLGVSVDYLLGRTDKSKMNK